MSTRRSAPAAEVGAPAAEAGTPAAEAGAPAAEAGAPCVATSRKPALLVVMASRQRPGDRTATPWTPSSMSTRSSLEPLGTSRAAAYRR